MQFSAELLVMQLHDADLRRAQLELERRRQAVERISSEGEDGPASRRSWRRPVTRVPRLALR